MRLKHKKDILMFIWIITLSVFIAQATLFNWYAMLYFGIGLYTSMIMFYWGKRNKEKWV